MIYAVLMASLSLAPSVEVDVEGLALAEGALQQLHRQLLVRLVEAGEAVGRPGTVHLRLAGGEGVVRVEVQHGRHVLARTVNGKGAVLRLSAIHAAIELLGELAASEFSADPALQPGPERTVVVEATAADTDLVPAAMKAIVDAGLVVVEEAKAGRRLCLARSESGSLRLGVTSVGAPCEPDRPIDALVPGVATALAEAPLQPAKPVAEAEAEAPASDSEPQPQRTETVRADGSPSISKEPAPRSTSWAAALGVGGGAQARLRSAEPLVFFDAAARHRKGPVLLMRVAFAPSRGGSLRAYDTFAAAGAGLRFAVGSRFAVQAGLAAGVSIHAFSVDGERDARVDFTAEVPLEVSLGLGQRFELGFAPVAGWAHRSRQHVDADGTLWSRERWRLGAALVIRVLWPHVGNSSRSRRL